MADRIFKVAIDWEVAPLAAKLDTLGSRVPQDLFKGSNAGAESLAGKLGAIGSAVSTIGGQLADAFTSAVERAADIGMTLAKLGAAAGVGAVTYGVASLNSELEKTQIGIADILKSGGLATTLPDAMGQAADLMGQLRKDAAALPGETADLARIFKLAMISGVQGGQTPGEIEKLSANAMAFGMGVANLDSGTVARELGMLLQGRAGSHNILGLQLGFGGEKAKELNAMTEPQRFAAVNAELAKHAGSLDLFSNSFEGLFSTLKDDAKQFLMMATSPLFESVKRTLGDINRWFDANKDQVHAWAAAIGTRLTDAFEFGKRKILEWWPTIEAFAEHAYSRISNILARVQPIVTVIAEQAKRLLGDPATLDRLESILKLYSVIKVGQSLAPSLGSIGSLAKVGGQLAGGLDGEGALGAGALGALANPATIAAVVGLGIALTGAAGAAYDLTDASSKYHQSAVEFSNAIQANLSVAFDELKGAVHALGPDILDLAGMMGENLLAGIHAVSAGAAKAMTALHNLALGFETGFTFASEGLAVPLKVKAHNDKVLEFALDSLADPTKKKGVGAVPSAGATVHIDSVVLNVSGNQEPSRIARVVMQHLAETTRYATSSRSSRNFLAGRQ